MPSSTSASDHAPTAAEQARILVYGNAGSGKTTMARALSRDFGIEYLCLDHIAWAEEAVRRPLADSLSDLGAFIENHRAWVIEGCYGDLIEFASPRCSELRFLNPGIETCVRNCKTRPWDPEYCESADQQQRMLAPLLEFVRRYDTGSDEYSRIRHRAIFDSFAGRKTENTDTAQYPATAGEI